MPNATRRLEFDSAHRVMKHESKCRNLHGHRYRLDVTVEGDLDPLGRVVDFSVIKRILGGWVDEELDHGTILNVEDDDLIDFCRMKKWKVFTMHGNPTAEHMAEMIFDKAIELLGPLGLTIKTVRLYETPNCWSEVTE